MTIGDSTDVGSDYRWPRDGDRLFVEASWSHDAQVVKDPKERFYRMPAGYSRAADLLVEQAAVNIVDRNNIIYAALFCYRQSVELHLKRILLEFGSDNRQAIITHNLAILWEQFIELAKAHDRDSTLGIGAAAAVIAVLDKATKGSDICRFPTTIRGLPVGFGDQGIDLDNLRDTMTGLLNFFECAYMDFAHHNEAPSYPI